MSRVSLRLLVVLIMFTVAVVVAAVWVTRNVPTLQDSTVSTTRCFPGLGQKVEILKPIEGGYFPEKAFYQDERRNKFVSDWYVRHLGQMREPSLLVSDSDRNTSYRFLWLRSFHPTVVVRLWRNGEKRMLSVKELSREYQNQPSYLVVDQTLALTDKDWATFVKLIEESCFWTVPTTSNGPTAMDGAWWVLEGTEQGYYHIATRQSPDSGSYRELALYMLKLSGLPLDESKGEIY